MADLHDELNGLIEARLRVALEAGETIDLSAWISQFAESLTDIIFFGALDEEQLKLIDHAHQQINRKRCSDRTFYRHL
jgi:hypothetical protein